MGIGKSSRPKAKSTKRINGVSHSDAIKIIEAALKEGRTPTPEVEDAIKQSVEEPGTMLDNILCPISSNPLLSSFLDGIATSTYDAKAEAIKKGKDPIAYAANAERRRVFIKNNIISQIQRL